MIRLRNNDQKSVNPALRTITAASLSDAEKEASIMTTEAERRGSPLLAVEMIPTPLWGANLRRQLSAAGWNQCKAFAKKESGDVCKKCGEVGNRGRVECHERWEWIEDSEPRVQRLVGLIALCPRCHQAIHFGLAASRGLADGAFKQLMKVNRWTPTQAKSHVDWEFDVWRERNKRSWTLDVSWLKDALGIDPDVSPARKRPSFSRAENARNTTLQRDAPDEDDHRARGIDDDSGYGADSYFARAMAKDD